VLEGSSSGQAAAAWVPRHGHPGQRHHNAHYVKTRAYMSLSATQRLVIATQRRTGHCPQSNALAPDRGREGALRASWQDQQHQGSRQGHMTLGTSPLLTPSLLVPPASPHRLQQQMSSRVQSQGQTWPRRAETAHDTRARGGKPHHFTDTEGPLRGHWWPFAWSSPDHRRSPSVYTCRLESGPGQGRANVQGRGNVLRTRLAARHGPTCGQPWGGLGEVGVP